jgi:hypothetical protein
MPVISMFYGLIVAMYYLDTKQNNLPHIHVKYGEMEGIYEIPGGELIEGSLPANKEKLIKAWIEIHQEDLLANWQLAVSGNKVFSIDPLK